MALAEVQRALAHLYTSEPERERLRDDPQRFARLHALSARELAQLRAIGDVRLGAYADALDRKRANECARILPLSAAAGGPHFRREFLRFARRVPLGAGPFRYRRDAAAFSNFVLRSGGAGFSPPARALLRFEAAGARPLAWYGYDVMQLARAVALGRPIDAAEHRPTLVARAFGRTFALDVSRSAARRAARHEGPHC
jgi:hypothetical protein